MIVLLLTFLLQAGILTSTEIDNLTTEEQQEYLNTYQNQIIIEDLEGM